VIPAMLVLGAIAVAAIVVYNGLVRLNALADNAWSDIDVQLKRRHDLIPNIVEAVRGHAGFERGTLERVVEARAVAMTAQGPAARGEAEGALGQALGRLVALVESYPELKAGASYARLQEALVMVEDALQNARRYYNAVVRDLNTATQRFPSNLFARMLGFTVRDYFQLTSAGEGEVPDVQLPDR
jgi:LemA protein